VTIAVARADPGALTAEPDNHLELAALVAGEDCGG
jgi:hypothetical protein